ncbi:MAG: hypothetical protein ACK4F9_00170 [Brevinematia bacterium]
MGYDTREVYDSTREHSPYAKVVIPPSKNGLILHGKVEMVIYTKVKYILLV